jgi:hypothetical protein
MRLSPKVARVAPSHGPFNFMLENQHRLLDTAAAAANLLA